MGVEPQPSNPSEISTLMMSFCLSVRLSPVKSVKSFATWQRLTASWGGGLSYRLPCTCYYYQIHRKHYKWKISHDLHRTVTRASASCDPNEFSMRQTKMPSSLTCTLSILRLLSDRIRDLATGISIRKHDCTLFR